MVGFANRQSFYASFYRVMGMTPRDYRLQHLEQHPTMKATNVKRGRKPKNAK
jgi:AraC-like DNA-binding protein